MDWKPIEQAPTHEDLLVCVTYNLGGPDEDGEVEYETTYWVDFQIEENGQMMWAHYPKYIWVPFPPTHFVRLPPTTHREKPDWARAEIERLKAEREG